MTRKIEAKVGSAIRLPEANPVPSPFTSSDMSVLHRVRQNYSEVSAVPVAQSSLQPIADRRLCPVGGAGGVCPGWSRGLQGPASRPVKNEHRTTSVPNRTAPAWACLGGRSSPGPDRQHGLAVGFQENERRCKGVRHMTPAEREKLRRERRKAGDRCYRITVNETDLEWALEYTPFTFEE